METVWPARLGKLLLSAKFLIQLPIDRPSSISLFIFMSLREALAMPEHHGALHKNINKQQQYYVLFYNSGSFDQSEREEMWRLLYVRGIKLKQYSKQ